MSPSYGLRKTHILHRCLICLLKIKRKGSTWKKRPTVSRGQTTRYGMYIDLHRVNFCKGCESKSMIGLTMFMGEFVIIAMQLFVVFNRFFKFLILT